LGVGVVVVAVEGAVEGDGFAISKMMANFSNAMAML
jgi:hypothetical protein|tara:strand:- start:468 stop:575 length:108 start_codon:yes stop_codon:yes gene_type:complete